MAAMKGSAKGFVLFLVYLIPTLTHGFVVSSSQGPSNKAPVVQTRRPNTRRHASSSPAVQDLLTKEFATELAEDVKEAVDIPFIPDPLVVYMLTQAIEKMSSELSKDTLMKLDEMMDAESTLTEYDDMPAKDRDALADQIARELNPTIDVPMFDEEQELLALKQIMRVVLQLMTTSDQERTEVTVEAQVDMARDLLQSKASRARLVQTLNEAVDIPLLDGSQEEAILEKGVDMVADMLESLLPPQLLDTLKGANPNGIAEMKSYLIDTVTEKVAIVGLGKEQERTLIETMVDIFIDTYVDETEAAFLVMTTEEQEQELSDRIVVLDRELELCERRYEREKEAIHSKKGRLQARLDTARRNRKWGFWPFGGK